jgi:type 1 glutamine amidotransferase
MKKVFILIILCTVFTGFVAAQPAEKKLRILVVTGGHGFDRPAFSNLLGSLQHIYCDTLPQPDGNELVASPEVDEYDVLVFYDMINDITPAQQQAYIKLLKRGKPMIFLHHSLVSYQGWPEFAKIVGGKYDTVRSNYQHDVTIPVKVEDKNHPVTKGLSDFEIYDEVYGNCTILPTVKPLLSTTHPKSLRYLAWINHYGNSDVLYIQLGHGPEAYRDPNFRRLLQQAIEWSAARHGPPPPP